MRPRLGQLRGNVSVFAKMLPAFIAPSIDSGCGGSRARMSCTKSPLVHDSP